jgi:hypothetical protein
MTVRALISKELNEGMVGVIEQRRLGIGFSLPTELRPGIEISEVTSNRLKRAVGILGTRPPYRDPTEISKFQPGDLIAAEMMAWKASAVYEAVHEIGNLVDGLDAIVVSRTGALAVRCYNGTETFDADYDTIRELDNGNYHLVAGPYKTLV